MPPPQIVKQLPNALFFKCECEFWEGHLLWKTLWKLKIAETGELNSDAEKGATFQF